MVTPKELCCLAGFVCYWAWNFCVLVANLFSPEQASGISANIWLLSTVFHVLTLAILGLGARKWAPYLDRTATTIVAPSATLVGFAIILAAGASGMSPETSAVIGSAFIGLGTGCMAVMWAELFVPCCTDYGKQMLLMAGVILCIVLYLILTLLPQPGIVIVLFIMPIACAIVITTGAKMQGNPQPCASPNSEESLSARFILFCLVFPIPLGFFQVWFHSGKESLSDWIPILVLAAATLVAVMAVDAFVYRRRRASIIQALVMPVMVAGMMVMAFLDERAVMASGALVFAAQQLMSVLLYSRFGAVAARGDMVVAKVFALGIGTTDCGFLIGMGASYLFMHFFPNSVLGLVLGITYLLMMVAFLAFGAFPRGKEPTAKSLGLLPNAQVGVASLARRFGLTAREEEILGHLLRGKSVPAIASEIFLSANTVRSHIAHIYRKLDVHGRDELISRVESLLE